MITNDEIKRIQAGIKKAGSVYITYNGSSLDVIRCDSGRVDSIPFKHLIGVYNGKSSAVHAV